MPAAHIRIRILRGAEIAFGPGKADLLDAIALTGSISGAARRLKMSYRRAWQLVDTMNRCFALPLVATATGGEKGGGAHLTASGKNVLARYRKIEQIAGSSIRSEIRKLTLDLADQRRSE